MADLADGESVEMQGSGQKPYILKNVGGVYSCSCPAWRNQSLPIDVRTCKHLKKLRGEETELSRIGSTVPAATVTKVNKKATESSETSDQESPDSKPALLLAQSWDGVQDVVGWHISEKLDGVRAYWDGKKFLSRLGNVYFAPDWFTAGLPNFALDGELWMGRGKFQDTVSVVRRKNGGEEWKKIKFLVFDIPDFDRKVEDRFIAIAEVVKSAPYAEQVHQKLCKGVQHLRDELSRVEKSGGEGLMLRQPGSRYERTRSNTLLKVKSFFDDEAVVIGYTNGQGRHKGRCGALKVRDANGVEFKIGTGLSDEQRRNPPKIGSVVCYRYQEKTKDNMPRFPSFVGVRCDVAV